MVLAVVLLGLLAVQQYLLGQIERIDGVFVGVADRPAEPTVGVGARALDVVLLGVVPASSTRGGADWLPPGMDVESAMLVHVAGDRRSVTVISWPLDLRFSLVDESPGAMRDQLRHASAAQVVESVEKLTKVRVDHLAVLEWTSLAELTDLAGGVRLPTVEQGSWHPELESRRGLEVLDYIDRGPETERVTRQQFLLNRIATRSLHMEMRHQPLAVFRLLEVLSRHVALDREWSASQLSRLVVSLRNLRSAAIWFVTAPDHRTSSDGVVRPADGSDDLWRAVREDRLASWVMDHPGAGLPGVIS